jgi:hypothetical protein
MKKHIPYHIAILAAAFAFAACNKREQEPLPVVTHADDAETCTEKYLAEWQGIYKDFEKDYLGLVMIANGIDDRKARNMLRGRHMVQVLEVFDACKDGRVPRNIFAPE